MGIVIPPDQLQPQTLLSLIEEFVTRDGAVYGHHDTPLNQQIKAVDRLLRTGEAVIVFDEEADTFTIALRDDVS